MMDYLQAASKTEQSNCKKQWIGLKELSSNIRIVNKKTNKCSAIVVMDKTLNLREGYRQLNHDPTQQIGNKVPENLAKMHRMGLISEKNPAQKPDSICSSNYTRILSLVDLFVVLSIIPQAA